MDHSDESKGKKDSIEVRQAEGAQSSESEEEKAMSVVSMGSVGKSEDENESSLNLRLASDVEDGTSVSSDLNEDLKASKPKILLDHHCEVTGNAYF